MNKGASNFSQYQENHLRLHVNSNKLRTNLLAIKNKTIDVIVDNLFSFKKFLNLIFFPSM